MDYTPPSSAVFLQNDVLHFLPVAAYTCDKEGFISDYNEEAVRLWGRKPVTGPAGDRYTGAYKLYGANGEYLPHEQGPAAACLTDGLAKKDQEIVIERPDHTRIYVRENVAPIRDDNGQQVGIVTCIYDVTAQKAALNKIEDRYHKMVEEVADYAIILLDRDGIILNWNKGAENIKGYKEEEIVGKSFFEFYLPQDQENGLPHILLQQARVNGKAVHEGWRKRKDGTTFWGSILLTALHDEHNNIIGFSKVTRDLTERKFAEDRTRKYLAQLEFQNKELEQFVYAASHDLKEPLRKIHLYTNFVVDNAANILDPKSRQYLERSINATDRMKNLIEDLLTYSRATANSEAYELLDLNQLANELFLFHKEEFEQKRVFIEKDNLPLIKAVPFQIKQLFTNLIDNAVKYRHPDRDASITINNELIHDHAFLPFKGDSAKQYYKISVVDNGIGFDIQYADRIFEIFQRLAPAAGINGSGIGLAICKKIVQNHNGFINAEGRVGKGASFHVYFPKNA